MFITIASWIHGAICHKPWPSVVGLLLESALATINSLCPRKCRHRSGSTVAQVMARWRKTLSHYLKWFWRTSNESSWHLAEGNFPDFLCSNVFEKYIFFNTVTSPWAKELTVWFRERDIIRTSFYPGWYLGAMLYVVLRVSRIIWLSTYVQFLIFNCRRPWADSSRWLWHQESILIAITHFAKCASSISLIFLYFQSAAQKLTVSYNASLCYMKLLAIIQIWAKYFWRDEFEPQLANKRRWIYFHCSHCPAQIPMFVHLHRC